jgi:hypothetical protein
MNFAVGKLRVQVVHHGEHGARDYLLPLFIGIESRRVVAEGAIHTEALGGVLHAGADIVFGKNFEVFSGTGRRTAASSTAAGCRSSGGRRGCSRGLSLSAQGQRADYKYK